MHEPPSESNYPLRQPRHNGHRRPPDDEFLPPIEDEEQEYDAPFEDEEEQEPLPPRRRQRGIQHQRERIATPVLPHNRLKNTLVAGAIAGGLCIVVNIIITFVNISTYLLYDSTKDQTIKNALAFTLFGYAFLTFLISMLICLVTGFIVGRLVVERRLAFLAGFVAGVIYNVVIDLIKYIPNYPGGNSSSGGGGAAVLGGIILILVFVAVLSLFDALASLLGGWLATRRHPYYVG
jgi:lipopolysaccharide export LptBFGC system permease protein LptF